MSQSKLAWLTPNLGILWISACYFWLCGSLVANPIIYTLVPSPSRFEIRQWFRSSMWMSSGTGISKIEIMLFTSVVASAAGTYLIMKDIMRLCANLLWCVPSRWTENVWFLLAITATNGYQLSNGVMYFSIPICLKLDLVILCFFLFPGCHMFQTRHQCIC